MILPNKTILRLILRKTLFHLNPERKSQASLLACRFLQESLKTSSHPVLSFASKPFEINLWPLNRWLAQEKRLLLPKVLNDKIEIFEVPCLKNLRISSLGIQEPNEYLCSKIETLPAESLFLIPALGFDEVGSRVGHGKGHYDRLLLLFLILKRGESDLRNKNVISFPRKNMIFT